MSLVEGKYELESNWVPDGRDPTAITDTNHHAHAPHGLLPAVRARVKESLSHQRHRADGFLAHGEPLDQVGAHLVAAAGRVGNRNLALRARP